ncbi:MAG: exodeoxyribonuclease V subunit gamma [Acidobacteriota bacterium]
MYKVWQSSRLENLADQIARELSRPVEAPLTPETVVVDGVAMGQWLAVEIARRNGVCSNVRFISPSHCVREYARAVLGDRDDEELFSEEVLAWRVLGCLRAVSASSGSPALRSYVDTASERDLCRLAERAASLLLTYSLHRPDWVESWKGGRTLGLGPDEAWQADLWRTLLAGHPDADPARRRRALIEAMRAGGRVREMPQRVMIFGTHSVPPADQEVFGEIARHVSVIQYIWTPFGPNATGNSDDSAEPTTGNSLLSALGAHHLVLVETALEVANIRAGAGHADPGQSSLLRRLQSDVLRGFERTGKTAATVRAGDASVQVHACHSPMRELEVLHDQLLAMFDSDPRLEPAGVLVLMTKPDTYAPLVDVVFHQREGEPYVPYSIVDRVPARPDSLVGAFVSILELAGSRFPVDRVLEPLECPAVQRRFGLEACSLPLIRRWLRESGVRWGKDGAHKETFGLPAIHHHTWRFGLDRMLLGFALPGDHTGAASPLFSGILPYGDIEGGTADQLGRFATYYGVLCSALGGLEGEKPPHDWTIAIRELFQSMFLPADAEEPSAQVIRNCIDRLDSDTRLADFTTPTSFDLIRMWLQDRLVEASQRGPFPTGKVTFAGIHTAFPAPARLICIIGLNDDDFPRRPAGLSFDLTQQSPRPTDFSARDDDRWSFLQTICAAREALYLSYVGADIRDNTERPPSVVLAELLDYIRAGFRTEDGSDAVDRVVTRHPLQAFNPEYFKGDPRFVSYSAANCAASLAAGTGRLRGAPLFTSPLPEPEPEMRSVDLDALIYFYLNPARYLLKRRVGIDLPYSPDFLEPREPFDLDYIRRQELLGSLLAQRLGARGATDMFELSAAAGLLPHGSLGDAIYAQVHEVVEVLAGSIERLARPPVGPPIPVQFSAHGLQLTGWLNGVSSDGVLGYEPDEIRPRHRLALWIRHLVLCHLRPNGVTLRSRWIGLDAETRPLLLAFDAVAEPAPLLADMLALYWSSLRVPLPFFVKSSYAYVEARWNGKDALAEARKRWDAPGYSRGERQGECENPYYLLTYRDTDPLDAEFESVAVKILWPLFEHQSEEAA